MQSERRAVRFVVPVRVVGPEGSHPAVRRAAVVTVDRLEDRTLFAAVPFTTQPAITTSASQGHGIFAADVDGDGDTDLLSASQGDNSVRWYENNGSGTFTGRLISSSAPRAGAVFAADLDEDGDVDVLSAAEDGNTAWYENDGDQGFTAQNISTGNAGSNAVFAEDFDGDGDLDVVADNKTADALVLYRNDGNEAFTPTTIHSAAGVIKSVIAEDVDGDGDFDLATAAQNSDEVALYKNNGTGTFTRQVVDANLDFSVSVHSDDIDGDGDVDLLATSWNTDTVAWYQNDGSENFTRRTVTTGADGANGVWTADFDRDGDIDVVSSSFVDDRVIWYENDGAGAFAARTISTAANQAQDVTAADFDGDGDADVASISFADNKVAWYRNDGFRFDATAAAVGTATINEGGSAAVLKLTVAHAGKAGDPAAELAGVTVQVLPTSGSTPLPDAQAAALLSSVALYADTNADGSYTAGIDTLVPGATSSGSVGGTTVLGASDGAAAAQVPFGTPRVYFVVATAKAGGSTATPNAFRITLSDVTAEDATTDVGLVIGTESLSATSAITIGTGPAVPPVPPPPPTGDVPPLVATVPSASMPAAAVAGQKTKASVRVEVGNSTGVAFSGPVTIRLLSSTDGTLDAGDAEVLTVVKKLKIKPGTSKAVKLKVKAFPATLPDGNYQLLAEVTPPVGATSVAATGSATAVAAPFVNLVGVSAAGPTSLTPGRKGKLSVTVQNTGNVTLAGPASVQIEAALGGNLAAKTPVATVPVKFKLKPGQVKRLSLKFLVPAELVAGSYNLVATLDSANVIAESVETDNVVNSGTATDVV